MNTVTPIDWEAWEVEQPPADFVDRVMRATLEGARVPARSLSQIVDRQARRKSSVQRVAILSAAAVVAGSFAVFATVGRTKQPTQTAYEPLVEAKERVREVPSNAPAADSATRRSTVPDPSSASRASGTVIDRRRRDDVRAKLLPALGGQGFERDPKTGFTIPSGPKEPSQNLTKEYIQARVREDFFPLARACYESALARIPTLRGRIVLDFMIVGDAEVGGIVDQAKINEESDITDPEFATCMRESMLSMVFEPPENDGWVTVSYPILFSPDDDEEGKRDP